MTATAHPAAKDLAAASLVRAFLRDDHDAGILIIEQNTADPDGLRSFVIALTQIAAYAVLTAAGYNITEANTTTDKLISRYGHDTPPAPPPAVPPSHAGLDAQARAYITAWLQDDDLTIDQIHRDLTRLKIPGTQAAEVYSLAAAALLTDAHAGSSTAAARMAARARDVARARQARLEAP